MQLNTESAVLSVAWSPDGKYLASGCRDGIMHLWHLWDASTTGSLSHLSLGLCHNSEVHCLAWSPAHHDVPRLASVAADINVDGMSRLVIGHPLALQHDLLIVPVEDSETLAVAWSPDGTRVATAGTSNCIYVWDAVTGACLATMEDEDEFDEMCCIAWSPDGLRLASSSHDKTVRVWDVADAQCLMTLEHSAGVTCVAFSPTDSKRLAVSYGKSVDIWDVEEGFCLMMMEHPGNVDGVAWSPDGQRLASGSTDKNVRLWDASGPMPGYVVAAACLQTLTGHTAGVTSVAWSPDGQTVASGSNDRTVRIWSV